MLRQRWCVHALVILTVLLPSGCGSGRVKVYPVKGKVLLKETNKPLTRGQIRFAMMGNPRLKAYGDIEPDGTFFMSTYDAADGAAAGEHKVCIFLSTPGEQPHTTETIATKYASFDTTDLTVKIPPGGEVNLTLVVERSEKK
jgi:hypothetical protein